MGRYLQAAPSRLRAAGAAALMVETGLRAALVEVRRCNWPALFVNLHGQSSAHQALLEVAMELALACSIDRRMVSPASWNFFAAFDEVNWCGSEARGKHCVTISSNHRNCLHGEPQSWRLIHPGRHVGT